MSYKNRANFKPLSEFIKRVNIKNKDGKVSELKGINIDKFFMPSVANVVGTDLTRYKVVKPKQFACNRMHVGRDYRLPIAVSRFDNNIIVSPAYDVFEIIDTNKLNPEYLMMWFSRSEFDRNCWFYTDTDVRGKLGWDSFCEIELPIPSIEKQNEIVKEYNIVVNRIKLNEQLNQKLEETAQALYKHWFVDFEFPAGICHLERSREVSLKDPNAIDYSKGYKFSGGEMIYNEELDKEIPVGWGVKLIKDFCLDMKSGGTPSRTNYEYWNKQDIPWLKTGEIKNNIILNTEEYISDEGLKNSSAKLLPVNTVLMSMYGANAGEVGLLKIESTTNQACCGMICKNLSDASFLYYHLVVNQEFNHSQAIGGAQQNLSKDYIENIKVVIPNNGLKMIFENFINEKENNSKSILLLKELEELLLSKMTKVEVEKEIIN